jgi:phospholipase/lecithinase/hemolysin
MKLRYLNQRVGALAMMLVLSLSVAAQEKAGDVFVFGDSLSDAGNIHLLTGQTTKSPYPLVPTYPYTIGGFHYSNGKTWAERFAQAVGDVDGGKASRANRGKNGNYAHGGARGRTNLVHPSPDALDQVQSMLADFGGAPSDALYVVQFGGNDVRDALEAITLDANGNPDLSASFGILFTALAEVEATIQTLYDAGARNFVVANVPNVANAPAVVLQGPNTQFITGIFVGTFNGELEGRLIALEANQGINIARFDMFGLTDDLVANPGNFGLTNVSWPCLNFLVESGGKCENPEEYMFWDGFHPTAAVHRIMADAVNAERPTTRLASHSVSLASDVEGLFCDFYVYSEQMCPDRVL